MMSAHQWLERAIRFELGHCIFYKRPVFISARDQTDGSRLWVVQMETSNGWVLGKDGEWYYEPNPSSRSDEFIKLTRFNSPDEAHTFWVKNVTEAKPLYL